VAWCSWQTEVLVGQQDHVLGKAEAFFAPAAVGDALTLADHM